MIDVNSQIIYLLTGWMPSIEKENQEKPLSSDEWTSVAKKLHSKNLKPKDLQTKNIDYLINDLDLDKDFSERILKLLNRSGQFLFEIEKFNTQGYELLTRIDSLYPKILKQNMKGSSPSYFWYIGNNSILNDSFVSLQYKFNKKNDYSFIEKDLFPEIKKNKFSLVLSFNDDFSTELAENAISNDINVLGFPPTGLLKLTKQLKTRKLLKTKKLLLLSQSYPSIIKYYSYNGVLQKKSELSISNKNIILDTLSDLHYKELNNISYEDILIHRNVSDKKLNSYKVLKNFSNIFKKTKKSISTKAIKISNDGTVYTVGHSNHSIEEFIKILKLNNIEKIIDVRTVPKSTYSQHFNKMPLKKFLKDNNIQYHHMKTLGGRPDKTDLLIKTYKKPNIDKKTKEDKTKYEMKIDEKKIEKEFWYQQSIESVINESKELKVALMCSEENPESCHRGYIVSHSILKKGIKVKHIRKNGETDEGKRFYKSFQQPSFF